MSNSESSFWAELKRRRVYNAAAYYAAAVFVVWQVADIVVPSLELPSWTMKAVIILSTIGFVPTLILSWLYDIRSEPSTPARTSGRLRMALAILTVVAFGSGGWWAVRHKIEPRKASLSEMSLAVFPFTVRTAGGLTYLREGLVDLLSRNLSGATDLQPLDPSLILKATKGEPTDLQSAGTIARDVGAGRFVVGLVSGTGSKVRIDATLYQLRDSIRQITTRTVEGDTTQLFALVDQLTAGLLSELTEGAATEHMVRTAAMTTQSLPALKAYLEGEQAYREGNNPDAVKAYSHAVELDSSFVLAQYRMAVAYHMNDQYWLAWKALQPVLAQKDHLQPRDRRVVEAFAELHTGKVAQAEQDLRSIITDFPRDLESRVMLALTLMHYSEFDGSETFVEARDLLETVFNADPKFICIYCKMSLAYQHLHQYDDVARILRLEGPPKGGGDTIHLAPVHAFRIALLKGDTATARGILPLLDTAVVENNFDNAILYLLNYAVPVDMGIADALAAKPKFGAGAPARKLQAGVSLDLAAGRWRAASQKLDMYRQTPLGAQARLTADEYLLWTPFELQPTSLQQLRDQLLRWLPDTAKVPANEAARGERGNRAFLIALASQRMGDTRMAALYDDTLAVIARDPMNAGNVNNARRVLAADRLLRANKPAEAVKELEQMNFELRPGQLLAWAEMLEYAKQLRVRGYLAVGRNEDALKWLRDMAVWGTPLTQLAGVWERDMATAYDQLGDKKNAARYYARFIELWQNADPELQPQVAAARNKLAALLPRS